jgi:hypothetical protein
MASRGRPRPGSLQALAAVLLLAAASAAAAGSPDRPVPAPPLFLPLTRSYPNASRLAASLRRGLGDGAHPNARMRLHDDLLTNGSVQFFFFICAHGLAPIFFGDDVLDLRRGARRALSFWFRYYTTRLYIGTPPQEFALIVDSGSTVTYVPCASCEQCGNHQVGPGYFCFYVWLSDWSCVR